MANITTQTIRVDLSTDKVLPTAFTHQNDTARTLVFDMYNSGMPYTMTGNTVKFAYKSPIVNGQYSVIAGASMASGTVSGNKVSVTLPVAYTAISGVGMLTMIITPTSGTVRPVNIRLVVQKSADGDDTVMGASDWPVGLYEYMDEWMAENEPTEIANLKSAFSDEPIEEYVQPFTIINNSQVHSKTGVISESSTYSRCDYTELRDCEYVTLEGATVINYCFYDKNKVYITGSYDASGNIERPENAVYIIFTANTTQIASAELHLHNCLTPIGKIYDLLNEKVTSDSVFDTEYINNNTLLQNVIGVSKFPNNLVVINECIDNKYISANRGTEVNDTNYFCTGFIPVSNGLTYKSNHGRSYAWYDSNKTYISGAIDTAIQNGIIAPTGATYLRFTINKSTDGIIAPFELYCTDINSYDSSVSIPNLLAESKPWCYGKTINWIGDSIVDGVDFDEQVCTTLGLTKLTTDGVNGGINGSAFATTEGGTDGRNAISIRYADMPNDADIIAVSAGTNDWMYAYSPIGTIESEGTNSFYGALKTLCEGLINKYPQKVIFFTTPIKRAQAFSDGNGGEYTEDGVMTTPFSKNKYGKTLGDYADIIKEVCGYYSIPVLDMYRESLLNPHISAQQSMFDSVLTHPNTTGQKIMARRVCGWITQLGYNIT